MIHEEIYSSLSQSSKNSLQICLIKRRQRELAYAMIKTNPDYAVKLILEISHVTGYFQCSLLHYRECLKVSPIEIMPNPNCSERWPVGTNQSNLTRSLYLDIITQRLWDTPGSSDCYLYNVICPWQTADNVTCMKWNGNLTHVHSAKRLPSLVFNKQVPIYPCLDSQITNDLLRERNVGLLTYRDLQEIEKQSQKFKVHREQTFLQGVSRYDTKCNEY